MKVNHDQTIPDCIISIYDYEIIVNGLDDDTYSYLESTIFWKEKKRILRIYDLVSNDDFNVFPIRKLTLFGTLYDAGVKFPLTLTKTKILAGK